MRPQTRKEPRKLLKMANQRQELQPVTNFLEFIRNDPLCWQDQQHGNPALQKYFDYQQTLNSYLQSESEVGEYLRRLDAAVRVWQMACLSRQDDDQSTIDAQISAWETLKSVWNERPETHFSSNTELDNQ